MFLRAFTLALVVVFFAGCAPNMVRSARLHDGKICVEPMGLESGTDLMLIAHAAGYLLCREHAFLPTVSQDAGISRLPRLVLLASAEPALGNASMADRQEVHTTLVVVCAAAAHEALRPERWPDAEEVIGACKRIGIS